MFYMSFYLFLVESVKPFFENGVARVPEREAETEAALAVREPH